MTFDRLLILLAILIVAGIAFVALPINQSAEHLYGYAVFGGSGQDSISYVSLNPNAPKSTRPSTSSTRAHFIVVGSDVYFDANNDGQPESSECFKNGRNPFELTSSDGRSRYRLTKATVGLKPEFVSDDMNQYVMLNVEILDPNQPESPKYQQSGKISVYPEPVDHGWAHFDGPLLMEFMGNGTRLPASGGPTVDLRLGISTPSVECSTNPDGKMLRSNQTAITPGLVVPTVSIDFPSASGEPITQRYDLDQFC